MRKFMKYEIKGTYKFILGLLAIIILASSIIQFNILNQINSFEQDQLSQSRGFLTFMMIISIFVIFAAFIVLFFYLINSFRKELYEDRGYLTFTLPLTGNQIVGSKTIVAFMWSGVVGIVTVLYNLILYLIIFRATHMISISELIVDIVNRSFIASLMTGAISSIATLLIIYFAISLSKVSIKNKKIGGFWFILFLVISGTTNFLINKIATALPYFIDLDTFKIVTVNNMQELFNDGMIEFSMGLSNSSISGIFPSYLNIASFIAQILFGILFFMGTGYLLEKKIELQ